MTNAQRFLHMAATPAIRRRAFRVALVVGTVFGTLNYGDKLLGGTMTSTDGIKALASYCIPYCVSTYSSVLALMERP